MSNSITITDSFFIKFTASKWALGICVTVGRMVTNNTRCLLFESNRELFNANCWLFRKKCEKRLGIGHSKIESVNDRDDLIILVYNKGALPKYANLQLLIRSRCY